MASADVKRFSGCKEMFAALSEYLDAELASGDCEEIEKHLRDCEPCIEFLESLNRTVRLCRDHGIQYRPGKLSAEEAARLREAYTRAVSALKAR